jgi:hypothetical protein
MTVPCIPFKANQYFGGIYHPQLQGLRISQARNKSESVLSFFFKPEDRADMFLQNVG